MSLDSALGVTSPSYLRCGPNTQVNNGPVVPTDSVQPVTDPRSMTTVARCQSTLGPGPITPQATSLWPLTVASARATSREDPTLEAQFRGADNGSHVRPRDQETRSHL